MSNQDNTYYLIDQYLKGELSKEEIQQVDKLLAEDPAFAEAFNEQQLLNNVIQGASIAELRAQMQADITQIDQSGKSFKKGYYLLGIGIIGAITIGYLFWPSSTNTQFNEEKNVSISEAPTTEKHITTSNKTTSTSPAPHIYNEKQPGQGEVVEVVPSPTNPSTQELIPIEKDTLVVENALPVSSETPDENKDFTSLEEICKRTTMQLDVEIQKACASENNGAIIIEEINGGEAPYTLFDKNSSAIIKDQAYKNLRAGKYELYVVDANSCTHEVTYYVPAKNCKGESIVIDLNANQGWKIPSQEAKITIYNTGGNIVYEKPASTALKEWMGLDKNGKPLAAGAYIYKMEYPDGKLVTGQINIMQ